jgi:two-component system CheB/CheR fusion protein
VSEDERHSFVEDEPFEFPEAREEQEALESIFKALFHFKRVDFTHYRQSTVMRRLRRRMSFTKYDTYKEYLEYITRDSIEAERLHDDLLLSFTEFFRDPQAFEILKQKIFPAMSEDRTLKSPVRVWVPGCSSGEEVYSLAVCLTEFFEENKLPVHAHIFGTDLSERHIATARAAVYPDKIRHRLSEDRLLRFFDAVPEGFRVAKHIREMCVFAVQDVTQDPPLPRIDLVSCRNVLIYFDSAFQDIAVPLFHFALKPSGFLWLGTSESLSHFSELFVPVDKKLNLFAKRLCNTRHLYRFPPLPSALRILRGNRGFSPDPERRSSDISNEVDRYILQRFSPTGVLVDAQMQIRRFLGRTSLYLEPSDGEASLKLSTMAKEGLMPDLYVAVEEAKKTGREVKKKNISFYSDNEIRALNLTVVPLRETAVQEPSFLILFEPLESSQPSPSPFTEGNEPDETVNLAEELRLTKDHLQSIIEEKDAVNQELWAANEEVQSTNEELQSVNEEMEAAKEELESSNEELIALNEELRVKNLALEESEDKFRHYLENARDIYFQCNLTTESFDYISPAVTSILGYTPEEFAALWRQIESTDAGETAASETQREAIAEAHRLNKTDLPTVEAKYRHRNGSIVWLSFVGRIVVDDSGLPIAVHYVARDITHQKAAALALESSEARFRGVFDNTGSGVAVYAAVDDGGDFLIMDFNNAAEKMEKASKAHIVGRRVTEVFPGVKEFGILDVFRKVWRDGRPVRHPIKLYKDSRIQGWRDNFVFRLPSGEVVAVYEDLSLQKQSEAALRESEARWQFAVDGNDLGLWDWNRLTDEVFFSEQWKRMLGYLGNEIGGTLNEWKKRVHPEDLTRTLEELERHLAGDSSIFVSEYRMQCKDGSYKWILDRGKVVSKDDEGRATRMIGTHTDVTERRRMEDQLRQSEKMQAVGQLAGGIAHDFNNQLAAVLGYAELLREEAGRRPDLIGYTDNIILGIKRASDLTAQLLAFARKGKYLSIPVDMHRIVFEVVNLLRHSIDKRIEIHQYLKATPATALGDPTQLQNAVLNLALNARDAMPQGGELIFATDVVELDDGFCKVSLDDINPGRYLQVSVIDSGTGIEKNLLPKIFEPFFTTKAPGAGTGMGLAAVYGTAKSHRGTVTVISEVGVGSTFRLLLPVLKETDVRPVSEAPSESPVRGDAHLLIVDDEQAVLEVTAEMLKRLGYRVSQCRNGREAVDFYRQEGSTVNLVILDVVMPIMSGKETFLALREINKDAAVLLSSGYSLAGEAQSIMDQGAAGFIQKPFRKSELSMKIAEILETKKTQ